MNKPILLFLLLLFTPAIAGAAHIKSYKITSEIGDVNVREDLLITLFNDGGSELKTASLTLPLNSEIISARDTYGDLSYTVSGKETKTLDFTFSQGIKPGEERVLIIALKAPLVTRKGDYSEYLLLFNPRREIVEFEHILRLPQDAELFSPRESFPAVVPSAEVSETSGVIILTWRTSIEADNPIVFLVRYKSQYFPIQTVIAYGLSGIILLVTLFFAGKEIRQRRQRTQILGSLKILNERERVVVAEVVKKEGIKQGELMAQLGYTKASLSKIITKLEARGLIRKVKSGKINRLYPGEKVK